MTNARLLLYYVHMHTVEYVFICMCRVNVIGSRGTRSFIYSVYSFAVAAVAAVAATDAVTAADDAVYVAPATGLSAYLSFLYTYEENTCANCRLFRDRDMIVIGFGPQSERLNGTNL